MALQATVSMSWVNTVLDAAAQQGAPRAQVLALAGIAPQELQSERWPIDHIARLWRAAVQATGDAGFGLKAGASVGPASFKATLKKPLIFGPNRQRNAWRSTMQQLCEFQWFFAPSGLIDGPFDPFFAPTGAPVP